MELWRLRLQESQLSALNADPHYADPAEKDRIIVPIDMAMRGVIEKYSQDGGDDRLGMLRDE